MQKIPHFNATMKSMYRLYRINYEQMLYIPKPITFVYIGINKC